MTSQISEMGHWIGQNLHEAATILFDSGPWTLIHNDVQAENLFFGAVRARECDFIDWQMATYARCVIDVANWVRGQLEPEVRRTAESQLLRLYHDALVANGVQDSPSRNAWPTIGWPRFSHQLVSHAVGLSEGLHAHPGAFWDTLIPR